MDQVDTILCFRTGFYMEDNCLTSTKTWLVELAMFFCFFSFQFSAWTLSQEKGHLPLCHLICTFPDFPGHFHHWLVGDCEEACFHRLFQLIFSFLPPLFAAVAAVTQGTAWLTFRSPVVVSDWFAGSGHFGSLHLGTVSHVHYISSILTSLLIIVTSLLIFFN